MILAKARLIKGGSDKVKVVLSFPTGFDPEEVVGESVLANGEVVAEAVRVDPRRGTVHDIYRECEVLFPREVLSGPDGGGMLQITGRFRRGLPFSASIPIVTRAGSREH
jgi:hypothetical protein